MQALFEKRRNHLVKYPQFNVLNEPIFDINEVVIWATNKAVELKKKGEKIKIVELGTRRSIESRPTHKKHLFQNIENLEYVLSDYQAGLDVDVVCDLHKTKDVFVDNSIDILISC